MKTKKTMKQLHQLNKKNKPFASSDKTSILVIRVSNLY